MNKSSSLLLHLHLLHFLKMNKSSYFKKKKKKEIFKKGLGTRGIGLVLLRPLSKKKKFINQIFSNSFKNSRFPNFSKKKFKIFNSFEKFTFSKFKKKSSLNSSSGTESYDPLPHSPVMQHHVNCPHLVFIETWSMSQTRGIRQVCQIIFNE